MVNRDTILGNPGLLCPKCTSNLDRTHIVQCKKCHTIVDIILAEPSEEPYTYFVDECSCCHDSAEKKTRLDSVYFPDAYV
ncbi:MAG: hypothetical protein GXX85_06050 [Ignavibacteria bacterium]|nr:hypothetical protein [Ignavibacteria bacterium]